MNDNTYRLLTTERTVIYRAAADALRSMTQENTHIELTDDVLLQIVCYLNHGDSVNLMSVDEVMLDAILPAIHSFNQLTAAIINYEDNMNVDFEEGDEGLLAVWTVPVANDMRNEERLRERRGGT